MKNKEKQIEEMSDLLEHIIFQYYPHLIPEEELKKHAEYALKYYQPKLPKDSIVLSGLELADYKHYKEYTKSLAMVEKETAEKFIKECKKYKVKKFSPVGIDQRDTGVSWIEMPEWKFDEFAKQFDVEVKE